MSESFKKIKKKHLLLAILKTAVIGLASGLGGVGIAFLVVTLGKFELQWFYYLIIGLSLLFAVGVPVFIKEYPREKALAKKLDENFGLKERVQTMVEYCDSDSELSRLQREDTNERLKTIEKKSINFKEFIVALIVAVICIPIFASGLAISFTTKAEAENPIVYEEPKFDYSLNRQKAMLELIEDVKNSNLSDDAKTKISTRLSELHGYVSEEERTALEVKTAVAIAVKYIDFELEGLTTYRTVHPTIAKIDVDFANGIVASLDAYKQYAFQYASFTNLTKKYDEIIQSDELLTSALVYFEKIEAQLLQSNVQDATHEHIKRKLETFVKDAKGYLVNVAEADSTEDASERVEENVGIDALIQSFITLVNDLDAYKDKINGYTDIVGVRAEINKYFSTFHQSFSSAMLEEIYPCMMQQYIRNKLCAVFQLSASDLPKITPDPVMPNDSKDPNKDNLGNNGGGGGGGTGDTLYASDDEIYDPDQAKYVKYGDILAEHEAKMQDALMSSDLPEEIKKAILAYFQYIGIYNQKE